MGRVSAHKKRLIMSSYIARSAGECMYLPCLELREVTHLSRAALLTGTKDSVDERKVQLLPLALESRTFVHEAVCEG